MNNYTLFEAILAIGANEDEYHIQKLALNVAQVISGVLCSLGIVLNGFVFWSALKCLRDDENRPGFASMANLALVDLISALWFLWAIVMAESVAWTDQTIYFEALIMARHRNISLHLGDVDFVRLCAANCVDHFIVFSSWLSLLVLSADRFIYITMGLRHCNILAPKRMKAIFMASWLAAIILSLLNFGHLAPDGPFLLLRRIVSSFWQLAFWATIAVIYSFYGGILIRKQRLLKVCCTRLVEPRGSSQLLELTRKMRQTLAEVKSSKFVLAILSSVTVSWVPSMVLFTAYTLAGLEPVNAIIFQSFSLRCESSGENSAGGDLFTLVKCIQDFRPHGLECSRPFHQVYQDEDVFCKDTQVLMRDQKVALLSDFLMHFVSINSVLNPLIYALSHKEFRRVLNNLKIGQFARSEQLL